ncbi:hypothetical protein [Nostoc sp.]
MRFWVKSDRLGDYWILIIAGIFVIISGSNYENDRNKSNYNMQWQVVS